MRKGQLFSGDIAIATMIFMVGLALTFFVWDSAVTHISHQERLLDMDKRATEVLEQLLRTPGVPEDWNRFTVREPGLVTDGRVINATKAAEFIILMNQSNYDDNRWMMGLGEFNFYMNVTDLNNTIMVVDGADFEAGMRPADETDAVANTRTAILNDTIVRVNFITWTA